MELSHCLVGAFVELDFARIFLCWKTLELCFLFSLIAQRSDLLLFIFLLACSCCRVRCPPGRAHSRSSGSARYPPGEVGQDEVDSLVHMLVCISQLFWHYCWVRIRTQLGVLFAVCSWRQSSWSSMWRLTGVPSRRSSDLLKLQIRWTFTKTSSFLLHVTYHFRGFFLS